MDANVTSRVMLVKKKCLFSSIDHIDSYQTIGYTLTMRLFLFLAAFILLTSLLYAHPGKTDVYGGHRCLKECAEWELLYGEYHLHDKEGRVVKISKKRFKSTVRENMVADIEKNKVEIISEHLPVLPDAASRKTAVIAMASQTPEPCISALLGLALLFLLILLLVVRRRSCMQK